MRRINWELPFKTMEYLVSLTDEIIDNPYVALITALQRCPNSPVYACTISLREDKNIDEVLLHLGATLGGHATLYAQKQKEELENLYRKQMGDAFDALDKVLMSENAAEEILALPVGSGIIEGVTFLDPQDGAAASAGCVKDTHYEECEGMRRLREILTNFKK